MDAITSLKNKLILVKKASGDDEPFDVVKLQNSLRNAGAEHSTILKIVTDVSLWIYSGVTTKQIYSRAFKILRRERAHSAMRYRLKEAIFALGPTGYPFEQFIGQLFEKQGYKIEVGIVVDGYSVTHEMDVIANKESVQILVECKYHKDQGKQVSVQVPLYVRSRVNDIIRKREDMPEYQNVSFKGWVITNTRFTPDSIQYAKYNDLHLLAWDYPQNKGLKFLVEDLKLYPITILHKLNRKEKQVLIKQGIIICSQLLNDMSHVQNLNLTKKKEAALYQELMDICI
ncbi:restriction endonuclease [Ancylomarina euxinus]|uniref:Restriction endonuclease n=1 Tax=Ancylomarina euxinus TaxID=2283627 RepID=A0A425Y2I7_9BACT|nr:restriction endonuclease [Ancylomarina euxinus]MCZ4694974.1 restriction endonuclease [Ancylomarina euxinus]MUP14839.1 ATP-binding protein [Ancylomarina euxinus]RRG22182.1 restriction endonuclease [Ancylomarina euxinus]